MLSRGDPAVPHAGAALPGPRTGAGRPPPPAPLSAARRAGPRLRTTPSGTCPLSETRLVSPPRILRSWWPSWTSCRAALPRGQGGQPGSQRRRPGFSGPGRVQPALGASQSLDRAASRVRSLDRAVSHTCTEANSGTCCRTPARGARGSPGAQRGHSGAAPNPVMPAPTADRTPECLECPWASSGTLSRE